jgi:hypothetical protein
MNGDAYRECPDLEQRPEGELSMRRTLLTLVVVATTVWMTASIVMAGMRVNSIGFSAVSTSDGSTTTLTSSSGGSLLLTASTSSNSGSSKAGGLCADPCVGLLLNAIGTLVGIAPAEETIVHIEATGIPIVECSNQGGNRAPGQNPAAITTSGDQTIGLTQITRNGTAGIDVTTVLPQLVYPGSQMGCPNDNWTGTITAIQFTSAVVTVFQDGVLTLEQSYVF